MITQIAAVVRHYFFLYVLVVFFLKSISIVYPPLPGSLFTVASIPFVGWQVAYAIDFVGSVFGALVSFLLGKKYGEKLLRLMLGDYIAQKVLAIKLKEKNQVESAVVLKIASGGVLSDGLAWGASLIGFKLQPFLLGYAISHVAVTLPIFYLLGASVEIQSGLIVGVLMLAASGLIFYFKGRYFE